MSKFAMCCVSGAMLTLASVNAQAEVVCRDGFEISGGRAIASPRCADAALGNAARAAGSHVSNKTLRDNPLATEETCAFLGDNAAARDNCPGTGPDNDD